MALPYDVCAAGVGSGPREQTGRSVSKFKRRPVNKEALSEESVAEFVSP